MELYISLIIFVLNPNSKDVRFPWKIMNLTKLILDKKLGFLCKIVEVQPIFPVNVSPYRRHNKVALHKVLLFFSEESFLLKWKQIYKKQQQKSETKKRANDIKTWIKGGRGGAKRKQNKKIYQTWKNNVFPHTRAILIKNDFMTLIFLVSFLNKHCKKECVHCRNYNYIIVKKIREI